jgi:hypothetical protein
MHSEGGQIIGKFLTNGRNPLKRGCTRRNDPAVVSLSPGRLNDAKPSIPMTGHEAITPFCELPYYAKPQSPEHERPTWQIGKNRRKCVKSLQDLS